MSLLQNFKDECLKWFYTTPSSTQRVGIEFEQFLSNSYGKMPTYEASNGYGIRYLLETLQEKLNAYPIYEGMRLIGLKLQSGGNISLEPGGQIELSGGTFENLHEVATEVRYYANACEEVLDQLGWKSFGVGVHPWLSVEQIPWMPKERYNIMRTYLPGQLAHNMMKQTCTVQVNLDYASEEDMIRKLRIAYKIQPFVTALFATSPIVKGSYTGYMCYRSHIWEYTDMDRSVTPTSLFNSDFGFESWIDYVFQVPMFFVYRNGEYINVAGKSFKDFIERKIPLVRHIQPTFQDFMDQLSIVFPPVRLKSYIEMRGADAGGGNSYLALAAFWTGLLYHPKGLDDLETMIQSLPLVSYEQVGRYGLWGIPNARFTLKMLLDKACEGLNQRHYAYEGKLENIYLDDLYKTLDRGHSKSHVFLKAAQHHNLHDVTYSMFGMNPTL